jgi:hypothetical protein
MSQSLIVFAFEWASKLLNSWYWYFASASKGLVPAITVERTVLLLARCIRSTHPQITPE